MTIKAKIVLQDNTTPFITEFSSEAELHKAARGWLKGARIKKLNPQVRRALSDKSMKGHFSGNPSLSLANGL